MRGDRSGRFRLFVVELVTADDQRFERLAAEAEDGDALDPDYGRMLVLCDRERERRRLPLRPLAREVAARLRTLDDLLGAREPDEAALAAERARTAALVQRLDSRRERRRRLGGSDASAS
jgi:hypothetical protein